MPSICDPDIYQDFLTIKSYCNDYNLLLNDYIPNVLLIGPQSAGKSRLLDCLVGYPVGLSKRQQCTMCPIEYQLVHNTECEEPKTSIQFPGKSVEICDVDQLSEKLSGYMNVLPKISYESVKIRFEYHKTINLCIIDLPGFHSATSSENPELWDVIEHHSKSENSIIVGITSTAYEVKNNHEQDQLFSNTCLTNKKMLLIHNKIDQTTKTSWLHETNLDERHFSDKDNYFFVTLNPNDQNLDQLTDFDQRKEEIESLSSREAMWLETNMYPKVSSSRCKKRIGFGKAKEYLMALYGSAVREAYPKLAEKMRESYDKSAQQLRVVESMLDEMDANKRNGGEVTDALLRKITGRFVDEFIRLLCGRSANISASKHGTTLFQDTGDIDAAQDAKREDLDILMTMSEFEAYVSPDQLLHSDARSPFLGYAAIDRMKKYFKLCMLTAGPKAMSEVDILNSIRSVQEEGRNAEFWPTIQYLVESNILRAKGCARWLTKTISTMMKRYCMLCIDSIAASYDTTDIFNNPERKLLLILFQVFVQGYLSSNLRELEEQWDRNIELLAGYLPQDRSVAALMMVLYSRNEDVIVDEKGARSARAVTSEVIINEPLCADRTKTKIAQIRAAKEQLMELGQYFSLVDIAEGGLQFPYETDASLMRIDYVTAVAQEYYLYSLFHFLQNFDMIFVKYFREKFTSKHILKMQNTLFTSISEHSEYQNILEELQEREEALMQRRETLKAQLNRLDTLIAQLPVTQSMAKILKCKINSEVLSVTVADGSTDGDSTSSCHPHDDPTEVSTITHTLLDSSDCTTEVVNNNQTGPLQMCKNMIKQYST